ncbi:MAG: hypothetical protein ABIS23_03475 [Sphingomicrobium sp.]
MTIRPAFTALLMLAAAACAMAAPGGNGSANAAGPAASKPAVSGGVGDPLRFVKAAYRLDDHSPDKPGPVEMLDQDKPEYSPRLRELFAIQQREHGVDEVGRLSMDIYTGTQDGDIKDIKVVSAEVEYASPPRRIVTATFTNMDRPTVMHFYFEQIGERWFLDDIATPGDGQPGGMPAWTLSTILKYGWTE